MWRNQIQLTPQILNIVIGTAGVFGDDFVATTVIANGIAKWHMHIQRQGTIERTHIALLQSLLVMLLVETCVKTVCCGIGSVSWAIFGQGFYQMPIKVYLTLWNVHVVNLFDFVIINKLIRTSLPLPSWTRFDLYQYIIVNKQFVRFFWFTSCT